MRMTGPSAAMYRYTVGPTAGPGRIPGQQCSERREEFLITARVAAVRHRTRLNADPSGTHPDLDVLSADEPVRAVQIRAVCGKLAGRLRLCRNGRSGR